MVDNQLKMADQILEKVKDFIDENRVVVITTAAFLAVFGLMNIFGEKKDTDKGRGSTHDKNLKRSSRRRYNSEGETVEQKPNLLNF